MRNILVKIVSKLNSQLSSSHIYLYKLISEIIAIKEKVKGEENFASFKLLNEESIYKTNNYNHI